MSTTEDGLDPDGTRRSQAAISVLLNFVSTTMVLPRGVMRHVLIRCKAISIAIFMLIFTVGSQAMTSTSASDFQTPPPETRQVPLRFGGHSFDAYCYNTQRCSIIYNDHDFGGSFRDKPSPAPPTADYRKQWGVASHIGIRNFPPPVELRWTSEDGSEHEATVDLDKIFKDRLIWHKVPKSDMKDFYRGPYASGPDVFLEINDRSVYVLMSMLVPTETEQIPGNKYSFFRDDVLLVWTHIY